METPLKRRDSLAACRDNKGDENETHNVSIEAKTSAELATMGGNMHCSDSFGRELWAFEIDGRTYFAQRSECTENDVDCDGYWTSDADELEGWFPDDERDDWIEMANWLE